MKKNFLIFFETLGFENLILILILKDQKTITSNCNIPEIITAHDKINSGIAK